MFKQITILAPGLLGASLAMAAKKNQLTESIHVWARRVEARANCAEAEWCDAVFADPAEAVEGSELVVLCAPVTHLPVLAARCTSGLIPGCIVTDVGSTKSIVCRECISVMPPHAHFIGSHPMAGSEKSGMQHAQANLFENRVCILTPTADTHEQSLRTLLRFWKAIGMETTLLSPEKHDEAVAHISHLPHVLASALCHQLGKNAEDWGKLSGGGLRDTTRVAAGDPSLWREILEQNREEILRSLEGFESALQELKSALYNQDYLRVQQILKSGKNYRDNLSEG